ncbi:hypothetical protein F5Y09DRAFT_342419 [Xylaria sp. FL1042]|nr:hypothetical protein F5Y09DRAFT_342419 [Xylaria sp. FL1042]
MSLAQSKQPLSMSRSGSDDSEPLITSNTVSDYEAQRSRVNNILKLLGQKATHYKLLSVSRDATKQQIQSAWRNAIEGIHPDKNKDSDSKRCAQAILEAKDILLDPQRRARYDRYIVETPRLSAMTTFDESFAPNAYIGPSSDDDAMESDDGDNDEELQVNHPPPSPRIAQLHDKLSHHLEALFRNLEGDVDPKLNKRINNINKKIEQENKDTGSQHHSVHTAPWHYISAYHGQQKAVFQQLKDSDINVAALKRSVHGLQSGFAVTCQMNVHQWPTHWVQFLVDPLRHQAEALGVLWEELAPQEADNNSTMLRNNDDDIEMEDCDDDNVEDNTIKPHRQGFTISGESILGYTRDARGDQIIDKMFVQIDHKNPIKIASISDVGALATKEYHDLPDDKKNDIRFNAYKYIPMVKLHFAEIVGIAWVPLSPGTTDTKRKEG